MSCVLLIILVSQDPSGHTSLHVMPQFSFNAKSFLLTYAHVENGLDPFRIVEVLGSLGAECIVARELYPTGEGFHFHVFCCFERKFRSRAADALDVDGFHPNIVPSRGNLRSGFDYATKDGDVVAGGLARPGGGRTSAKKVDWATIVGAGSREEFFDLLEELDPEAMVRSFPAIQKFADWNYREEPEPYVGPDGDFDIASYGGLSEWVDQMGTGVGEHTDALNRGGRFAASCCPPGSVVLSHLEVLPADRV